MPQEVIYWDTSAALSSLLQDSHSQEARLWLSREAVHLVSSLAGAEFCACLARLQREGHLPPPLAQATVQAFEQGPWQRIVAGPDPDRFWHLSCRHPLRGADLWHLTLAKTLQQELPELKLLTFDVALAQAAQLEGIL